MPGFNSGLGHSVTPPCDDEAVARMGHPSLQSSLKGSHMPESVTAKQLIEHLSPYNIERVRFQMPDGLPVIAVYIDTDEEGGAMITLSDTPLEDGPPRRRVAHSSRSLR